MRSIRFAFACLALVGAIIIAGNFPVDAQLNQSGGSSASGSNASVGTYPATAPASATLTGGQFNTSPPTLTNGQMGTVQLDSSGSVKVAPQGTTTVSGTVATTQSGTWTLQPGNTANTTPWFVKVIDNHTCSGNTTIDTTTVSVATSAGTDVTTSDTCVDAIYVSNKTGSAATLTVRDRQGTPVEYATAFSIPANSILRLDFGFHKFTTGVNLVAGTATALNAITKGVQ